MLRNQINEIKTLYDKERSGELLEEPKEPYIELLQKDRNCRLLALFASIEPGSTAVWEDHDGKWICRCDDFLVEAICDESHLQLMKIGYCSGKVLSKLAVQL